MFMCQSFQELLPWTPGPVNSPTLPGFRKSCPTQCLPHGWSHSEFCLWSVCTDEYLHIKLFLLRQFYVVSKKKQRVHVKIILQNTISRER